MVGKDLPLARFAECLWTPVKLRKATRCKLSDVAMAVGDIAYRPVTNGNHRMWRIHPDRMQRYHVRAALPKTGDQG